MLSARTLVGHHDLEESADQYVNDVKCTEPATERLHFEANFRFDVPSDDLSRFNVFEHVLLWKEKSIF